MTTIFGQINSFLDYENEVLTPDWLNSGHEIPSQGEKLQPSKRLSRFFRHFVIILHYKQLKTSGARETSGTLIVTRLTEKTDSRP